MKTLEMLFQPNEQQTLNMKGNYVKSLLGVAGVPLKIETSEGDNVILKPFEAVKFGKEFSNIRITPIGAGQNTSVPIVVGNGEFYSDNSEASASASVAVDTNLSRYTATNDAGYNLGGNTKNGYKQRALLVRVVQGELMVNDNGNPSGSIILKTGEALNLTSFGGRLYAWRNNQIETTFETVETYG